MAPTVTTQPADQIMTESAELNAYVNPNGSRTHAGFQYFDSHGRAYTSSFIDLGVTPQSVPITISALTPNMTYSYYVIAYNAYGTVQGSTLYFTTGPEPPSAQTQPATLVTANSAVLNGLVDPKNAATDAFFRYGATDLYGGETRHTNCGLVSTNISLRLSDLSAASTYHCQLVASNAFGISYGDDVSFTTPSPPAALEATFFTNSAFRILLHTFGPGTYAVDGTSDFVNWDNIGTYTDPQDPTEVLDGIAISSQARFYRAYQILP